MEKSFVEPSTFAGGPRLVGLGEETGKRHSTYSNFLPAPFIQWQVGLAEKIVG
jgi:hypothetical protein